MLLQVDNYRCIINSGSDSDFRLNFDGEIYYEANLLKFIGAPVKMRYEKLSDEVCF